jgi:hypothetical protein
MSDDQVVRLVEEVVTFRKRTQPTTEWLCRTNKKPWRYRSGGYRGGEAAFVGLVGLFIFLGGTCLVSLLSWFFNGTLRH